MQLHFQSTCTTGYHSWTTLICCVWYQRDVATKFCASTLFPRRRTAISQPQNHLCIFKNMDKLISTRAVASLAGCELGLVVALIQWTNQPITSQHARVLPSSGGLIFHRAEITKQQTASSLPVSKYHNSLLTNAPTYNVDVNFHENTGSELYSEYNYAELPNAMFTKYILFL